MQIQPEIEKFNPIQHVNFPNFLDLLLTGNIGPQVLDSWIVQSDKKFLESIGSSPGIFYLMPEGVVNKLPDQLKIIAVTDPYIIRKLIEAYEKAHKLNKSGIIKPFQEDEILGVFNYAIGPTTDAQQAMRYSALEFLKFSKNPRLFTKLDDQIERMRNLLLIKFSKGKPFNLSEIIQDITRTYIIEALIEVPENIKSDESELHGFSEQEKILMGEFIEDMGRYLLPKALIPALTDSVIDSLPGISWNAASNFKDTRDKVDQFIYRIIDQRIKYIEEFGGVSAPNDYLTVLCKAIGKDVAILKYGENVNDSELTGIILDKQIIRNTLLGTLLAGYTTTSETLNYGIAEIEKNPDVKLRLRNDFLSGNYKNEYSYTQAVVDSILATGASVWSLQRSSEQDMTIIDSKGNEISIPAGTSIIASLTAMHQKIPMFANGFDPDALYTYWQSDKSLSAREFMPFGTGPRHCVGSEVARMEMFQILGVLYGDPDIEITRIVPRLNESKAVVNNLMQYPNLIAVSANINQKEN